MVSSSAGSNVASPRELPAIIRREILAVLALSESSQKSLIKYSIRRSRHDLSILSSPMPRLLINAILPLDILVCLDFDVINLSLFVSVALSLGFH